MSTLVRMFSQWILGATAQMSLAAFRHIIFAPLAWVAPASQLFVLSRDVVIAGLALATGWSLLATMWPVGLGWREDTPGRLVGRVLTAGLLNWLVVPGVSWLLRLNNQVVVGLVARGATPHLLHGSHQLLSPLVSTLIVIVSAVLLVYLGIFYAMRTVEIYVLTALGPWMIGWWAVSGDPSLTGRWLRETMAAIFVQSAQAAVFWLYLHVIWDAQVSGFETVGVLVFMSRIPDQLRRLLNAGGGFSLRWR